MKTKFNRNILWAEIFVRNLAAAGIEYACISPGSRSTPLTYAFASNKNFRCFVHIDERSGSFFAGGLARKTRKPVVLVCTSGTAVAEFYPGIIEAYQQRIPLIVCTADRPLGAYLKGFNQTINQDNIFRNHIRWYADAGMPDPSEFNRIKEISFNASREAIVNQGPVHINFHFDKPFEPDNFTDEIEEFDYIHQGIENIKFALPDPVQTLIEKTADHFIREEQGLITVGPSNFSQNFREAVIRLSELAGYPVIADGTSQLRSGEVFSKNIFSGYDAVFRSGFFDKHKPGLILHFGRTLTSKGYEDFLNRYYGSKYLVNAFGDIFDPADKYDLLIRADEEKFTARLVSYLEARNFNRKNSQWFEKVKNAEAKICGLIESDIKNEPFPDEGRIITEIIEALPSKCSLMLSNSMPVRDFDYFSGNIRKELKVFHNRGASGIDGINSTAFGIAATGEKTVLVTGDLAFYHDLNGLAAYKNFNIPLTIILVNNNGGGIFNTLPVSGIKEYFNKFFITPHNLDFSYFVEGYSGFHKKIAGWKDLSESMEKALDSRGLSVLEIQTDAEKSLSARKSFWAKSREILNDNSSK